MLPTPRISEDVELKEMIKKLREKLEFPYNLLYAWNSIALLSKKAQEGSSKPDSSESAPELVAENKFPYTCPECYRCFKNKQGLNQHKGKVHCKEIKWKSCFVCGKKFKHKHAVRFHVLRVHKKATRTKCPHCDRCFYRTYELDKHLIRKHS